MERSGYDDPAAAARAYWAVAVAAVTSAAHLIFVPVLTSQRGHDMGLGLLVPVSWTIVIDAVALLGTLRAALLSFLADARTGVACSRA